MEKEYYVYILTNRHNSVLYTGVTSDIEGRLYEHQTKALPGFTSKYNVSKLVYYESFDRIVDAINREKQIKGGSRSRKIRLVESLNPEWKDLYHSL